MEITLWINLRMGTRYAYFTLSHPSALGCALPNTVILFSSWQFQRKKLSLYVPNLLQVDQEDCVIQGSVLASQCTKHLSFILQRRIFIIIMVFALYLLIPLSSPSLSLSIDSEIRQQKEVFCGDLLCVS